MKDSEEVLYLPQIKYFDTTATHLATLKRDIPVYIHSLSICIENVSRLDLQLKLGVAIGSFCLGRTKTVLKSCRQKIDALTYEI